MGDGKCACCQPLALSFEKVADPRSAPAALQRCPTCAPPLAGPLKKRTAVTIPSTSDLNRTPTSMGFTSDAVIVAGTLALVHRPVGNVPGVPAVAKSQE